MTGHESGDSSFVYRMHKMTIIKIHRARRIMERDGVSWAKIGSHRTVGEKSYLLPNIYRYYQIELCLFADKTRVIE